MPSSSTQPFSRLKVVSLTKFKHHYKDQWSMALSELAISRQQEAAARNKLLTQQQELEALRVQYFQQEQQNSLKQQLSQVKKDVNRCVCLMRGYHMRDSVWVSACLRIPG